MFVQGWYTVSQRSSESLHEMRQRLPNDNLLSLLRLEQRQRRQAQGLKWDGWTLEAGYTELKNARLDAPLAKFAFHGNVGKHPAEVEEGTLRP